MRNYAAGTEVSAERSKAELDRLLAKHGATQRLMGSDDKGGFAHCMFAIDGRQVRLRVPSPTPEMILQSLVNEEEPPRGWWGWRDDRRLAWAKKRSEQLTRERWRSLVLLVKAKLEIVALGISTVEREFLADLYLANGRTVHEEIEAGIAQSYLTGSVPKLLGSGS